MRRLSLSAVALALLAADPAFAHTGIEATAGFKAGFGHPVMGLDHVLAMIAVGILAFQQGGHAVWAVPSTFVGMMVLAAVAGVMGLGLPFVEVGVVGSVVVLGSVVALGRQVSLGGAMALVGLLAVFHGYVHGSELPHDAAGLAFGLGFVLATSLLHLFGVGFGLGAQRLMATLAPVAVRAGGCAIALGGLGLALV